jgi:Alpha/beta hydrolase family
MTAAAHFMQQRFVAYNSAIKIEPPTKQPAPVSAEQAAFMADSQVPWGVDALGGTIGEPAWPERRASWRLAQQRGASFSSTGASSTALAGMASTTNSQQARLQRRCRAKRVIDAQSEPVILVGHSYGGAVITEAGNHPKVAALVYIAAFVPDKGESVNTLIAGFPTDGPQPPILPPQDGFLLLDREKFNPSFAGDLVTATSSASESVGFCGHQTGTLATASTPTRA